MTEKELIQGCLNDNRSAQEALYRRYADAMYRVALTYARDEDTACDILQDSFIKVFRKLNKFSGTGSLEGWIRKIVVNTALSYYQKKKKERENQDAYLQTADTSIDELLASIHAEELVALVNQLPEKAGLVLKLFSIEGYDHKEIAELMQISEGTSKSQLSRARALLKEAILQANQVPTIN